MKDTVAGLYLTAVANYPDRTFIRHLNGSLDERVTYRKGTCRVAATAEHLQKLGLKAGDRVVCYLEEVVPATYFVLACAHLGVGAVPLSPSFSIAMMKHIGERIEAKAYFTTEEFAAKLVAAGIHPLVYTTRTDLPDIERLEMNPSITPEAAEKKLRALAESRNPNETFIIQPTSGTTGGPKLAIRSNRPMVGLPRHFAVGMEPTDEPQHRVLMCMPLTHGAGYNNLNTALYLAAELSVPNQIATSCSLRDVRTLDPTYLPFVPRVIRSLYRQYIEEDPTRSKPMFGPSAKVLSTGGAPIEPELLQFIHDQGIHPNEIFSSAETGIISSAPVGQWRKTFSGKMLPDVQVRIDTDGELCVKSVRLFDGYYDDPELTRQAFTEDGLYRTGDFAEIKDGYLRILGRKKDVFNTSEGSNIHPVRIETLIEALPWVKQVALIGDQRPFLVALIVVSEDMLKRAADVVGIDDSTKIVLSRANPPRAYSLSGYLPAQEFPELYKQVQQELRLINTGQERIERVVRFALFDKPMTPELYSFARGIKTRRNRKGIEEAYAETITMLYSASPPAEACVPDATAG